MNYYSDYIGVSITNRNSLQRFINSKCMAESAVQLFYIRKGAFSQMLQYVLPCVSVWHDHVSVLIISLLPFMQGDSGCHWYCAVPALHSDTGIHVQMEVFICEYKYSFFLPRLLATEDKVFWPERKEWKHLGSKKIFKASASWTTLTEQLSGDETGLCPRLDVSRIPFAVSKH